MKSAFISWRRRALCDISRSRKISIFMNFDTCLMKLFTAEFVDGRPAVVPVFMGISSRLQCAVPVSVSVKPQLHLK